MNMTMTPVATMFAILTGIALFCIILILIFDRPKRPKDRPADEEHAKEASHRL
jgi:hypothetical protein